MANTSVLRRNYGYKSAGRIQGPRNKELLLHVMLIHLFHNALL